MKLDDNISNLICKIEYIIGSSCSNPHSYDGWQKSYGCNFRYPVCFDNEEYIDKVSGKINDYYETISPKVIQTMHYKFGANQLNIGIALQKVLEMLEKRYDLDFNDLEEQYAKKTKSTNKELAFKPVRIKRKF